MTKSTISARRIDADHVRIECAAKLEDVKASLEKLVPQQDLAVAEILRKGDRDKAAGARSETAAPDRQKGSSMSVEPEAIALVMGADSDEIDNPRFEDRAQRASDISRRSVLSRVAFFGAAMAAVGSQARAQAAGSGGFSDAAVALPTDKAAAKSGEEQTRAVKIARAMRSGPPEITKEATVAEMDQHGNMTAILRQGTNGWVCVPGDENRIGDPPMCIDELGMQWFRDVLADKPRPTNKAPGLCYMLCGATQHSNTDPLDKTSPAIPIGPHWMILWPFDAKHCGLPTTVRDAGAWIMFAGTPYAYLHVCGTPWAGNEYSAGDEAVWTMQYAKR